MENELVNKNKVEEPESIIDNPEPENEQPATEIDATKEFTAGLEQALSAKDGEISALNRSLDEAKGASVELTQRLALAIDAYRGLVIQMNPGVLADMVTGDSIERINESLQSARAIMEKARREIEADAARARVPAGAPQRTPPDMSALSAREKIQYGLGG